MIRPLQRPISKVGDKKRRALNGTVRRAYRRTLLRPKCSGFDRPAFLGPGSQSPPRQGTQGRSPVIVLKRACIHLSAPRDDRSICKRYRIIFRSWVSFPNQLLPGLSPARVPFRSFWYRKIEHGNYGLCVSLLLAEYNDLITRFRINDCPAVAYIADRGKALAD